MCPIRKNYIRRLLDEAGFERVRTYGDFQETYSEGKPDFFIHVAEKSALHLVRWGGQSEDGTDIRTVTEDYYDSDDADLFYSTIWGGEDLHIGDYTGTSVIREASDRIVYRMIDKLGDLGAGARVLDLGAGYGGAMRKLVKATGAQAVCLNISETQNDYNRAKIREAVLGDSIAVRHGVFEDVPEPDASFDVVWSQDAFLHSDQRATILAEAFRVLKPGGTLIFTDPMQADDVTPGALQAVYDRLQLNDLGSMQFYRQAAEATGFALVEQEDGLHNLRTHYARVLEELQANEALLRDAGASLEYLSKMAIGLQNWVDAADARQLAWGIQVFRKPD
jgi:sarcosine/dimethylglycine N-methyltransferase